MTDPLRLPPSRLGSARARRTAAGPAAHRAPHPLGDRGAGREAAGARGLSGAPRFFPAQGRPSGSRGHREGTGRARRPAALPLSSGSPRGHISPLSAHLLPLAPRSRPARPGPARRPRIQGERLGRGAGGGERPTPAPAPPPAGSGRPWARLGFVVHPPPSRAARTPAAAYTSRRAAGRAVSAASGASGVPGGLGREREGLRWAAVSGRAFGSCGDVRAKRSPLC